MTGQDHDRVPRHETFRTDTIHRWQWQGEGLGGEKDVPRPLASDIRGIGGWTNSCRGFDALQPLEAKAHMDVRELAPTVGDRLTLFGNIDVMTMSTNDLDKIEAEIASKFAAGKSVPSYISHSDHSVPPAVSWETYQGVIDLVEKHGWYE